MLTHLPGNTSVLLSAKCKGKQIFVHLDTKKCFATKKESQKNHRRGYRRVYRCVRDCEASPENVPLYIVVTVDSGMYKSFVGY